MSGMKRDLTWQEKERLEQRYEQRREAAMRTMEEFRRIFQGRMSSASKKLVAMSKTPAWLDLCMASGLYEDDLAASHGCCEDVWT